MSIKNLQTNSDFPEALLLFPEREGGELQLLFVSPLLHLCSNTKGGAGLQY